MICPTRPLPIQIDMPDDYRVPAEAVELVAGLLLAIVDTEDAADAADNEVGRTVAIPASSTRNTTET